MWFLPLMLPVIDCGICFSGLLLLLILAAVSLLLMLLRSKGYLNTARARPFCQAMIDLRMHNQGVPERLHPKSFHSMFNHNTNVWASRDAKVMSSL